LMANEIFTAEQEQQILKAYQALDEKLAVTELDVAAGHQRLMAKLQPEPSRQPRPKASSQSGGWLAAWNPWTLVGSGLATGCVATAALLMVVQVADDGSAVGSPTVLASGGSLDARRALADAQSLAMAQGSSAAASTNIAKLAPMPADQNSVRRALTVGQSQPGKVARIPVGTASPLTSQELLQMAANAGLSAVMTPLKGGVSILVLNLEPANPAHQRIKKIGGLPTDFAGSAEFNFRQR
jgi:hypothetical protein